MPVSNIFCVHFVTWRLMACSVTAPIRPFVKSWPQIGQQSLIPAVDGPFLDFNRLLPLVVLFWSLPVLEGEHLPLAEAASGESVLFTIEATGSTATTHCCKLNGLAAKERFVFFSRHHILFRKWPGSCSYTDCNPTCIIWCRK